MRRSKANTAASPQQIYVALRALPEFGVQIGDAILVRSKPDRCELQRDLSLEHAMAIVGSPFAVMPLGEPAPQTGPALRLVPETEERQ